MSKIVEYYNSLSNDPRQETLSKTFINFYLLRNISEMYKADI